MATTATTQWRVQPPSVKEEQDYGVYLRLIDVYYGDKKYPIVDSEMVAVYMGDGRIEYWSAEDQQKYEADQRRQGVKAIAVHAGFYWNGRLIDRVRDDKDYAVIEQQVKNGLPKPPKPPEKIVVETKIIHNWGVTMKAMVVTYILAIITQSYLMWQFATVYGG